MKISHEIRAEAQKEGLEAMAARYRDGGDLYMPVENPAETIVGEA